MEEDEAADGAARVQPLEILITFDTTGSMYPSLTQVRREVQSMLKTLKSKVPDVRLAVLAHGDYGDSYVTKSIDLTTDVKALADFVKAVPATGGSDWVSSRFLYSPALSRLSYRLLSFSFHFLIVTMTGLSQLIPLTCHRHASAGRVLRARAPAGTHGVLVVSRREQSGGDDRGCGATRKGLAPQCP